MQLDEIPSPFLAGLMDQFMGSGFTPLIVTNRGCPFQCEFCGEGDRYLSKVGFHSVEYSEQEFEYIASKMVQLDDHPFPDTMYFADSNSGMYKQDLEVYARFGEIQKRYGYPKSIITATGKNVKSRVIESIKLLNGAISLTASVQSTDAEVLKSIKRDNISVTDIVEAAQQTVGEGGSYSEIILGLPGDSYERHTKSIKDMIDCRIDTISTGQLLILNDTPMASPEYKSRHGLKTRFRFMVKGYMKLPIAGEERVLIEEEEVCVETNELPFSDYLRARVANLFMNIFYNNKYNPEHFAQFEAFDISVSDYIFELIKCVKPNKIEKIVAQFKEHLQLELYDSLEDLRATLKLDDIYDRLINGEIAVNLLGMYTAKCMEHIDELAQMEEQAAQSIGGVKFSDYITSRDKVNTRLASHFSASAGTIS